MKSTCPTVIAQTLPGPVQIVGSALGVLAAISSGEGGQPPLFFSMFIVGAAALTTLTLCSVPIVRDSLEEV